MCMSMYIYDVAGSDREPVVFVWKTRFSHYFVRMIFELIRLHISSIGISQQSFTSFISTFPACMKEKYYSNEIINRELLSFVVRLIDIYPTERAQIAILHSIRISSIDLCTTWGYRAKIHIRLHAIISSSKSHSCGPGGL